MRQHFDVCLVRRIYPFPVDQEGPFAEKLQFELLARQVIEEFGVEFFAGEADHSGEETEKVHGVVDQDEVEIAVVHFHADVFQPDERGDHGGVDQVAENELPEEDVAVVADAHGDPPQMEKIADLF